MGDVLLIMHILAAAIWLGAGATVGFLTHGSGGQAAHTAGDCARLDRISRFRAFGATDTLLIVLAIVVMVLKLGA